MGLNVSTTINNTIVKNTLKTAVNSLQQIQQTNEQSTSVSQKVQVTIDGKLTCDKLTVAQDAQVTLRSYSAATAEQTLTMAQQVAQELQSQAKTQVDQKNKDLNVLQTNLSTVVNNAIEETQQEQIVAMTQAFQQTVSQTSDVKQDVVFTVGPGGEVFITGTCDFSQTSTVDYTATSIVQAAMDVITSQAAVQKAITEWDTAIKQSNEGINFLGLWIALAIIGVVIIIALGVYFGYIRPKKRRQMAALAEQREPLLSPSEPRSDTYVPPSTAPPKATPPKPAPKATPPEPAPKASPPKPAPNPSSMKPRG